MSFVLVSIPTKHDQFCKESIQALKDVEKGSGRCVFDTALNPDPRKGHPNLNDDILAADGWMLMVGGMCQRVAYDGTNGLRNGHFCEHPYFWNLVSSEQHTVSQ